MPIKPLTQRYAVGLYRVSTAEQGQSGLGLEAQQASVRAFAAAQGWTLVAEFSDVASGMFLRLAVSTWQVLHETVTGAAPTVTTLP